MVIRSEFVDLIVPTDANAEALSLVAEIGRMRQEEKTVRHFIKKIFKPEAYRKHALDTYHKLGAIRERLNGLTSTPLPEKTLNAIFHVYYVGGTEEQRAEWVRDMHNKQTTLSSVSDLTKDITSLDEVGSRGDKNTGYFSAKANGKSVVLYRGWHGENEQWRLLSFLQTLGEKNREARAMLPEIYGKAIIDGKTYLVMENLEAIGIKANGSAEALTIEHFLQARGGLFTDGFVDRIRQSGLNITRDTLETDYLFVTPSGTIRMGIPFRALRFTHEALNMFRGLKDEVLPTLSGGQPMPGIPGHCSVHLNA